MRPIIYAIIATKYDNGEYKVIHTFHYNKDIHECAKSLDEVVKYCGYFVKRMPYEAYLYDDTTKHWDVKYEIKDILLCEKDADNIIDAINSQK